MASVDMRTRLGAGPALISRVALVARRRETQ